MLVSRGLSLRFQHQSMNMHVTPSLTKRCRVLHLPWWELWMAHCDPGKRQQLLPWHFGGSRRSSLQRLPPADPAVRYRR
jgi:hypothetical protein